MENNRVSEAQLEGRDSHFLEVKKTAAANVENTKSTSILLGFVLSLSLIFVALEYTHRDREIDLDGLIMAEISLEPELVPITLPEKKTTPPPPQSTSKAEVIEIVENDAEIEETTIASTEDQVEFVEITEFDVIEVEPEPEEEAPFQVVEKMPEFPGGQAALVAYLSKNIKYPSICRENNIQGRVLIQFTVNKDGSIVDCEVMKNVNPYLDKEALRVVSGMPKWIPGEQRGKAVRVRFTVPVMFKLN